MFIYSVIAKLLESKKFRALLDKISIQIGVETHPNLPSHLNAETLRFVSIFLTQQDFISKLKCEVFEKAASNSTLIDRLPVSMLRSFSMNSHFWNCVPLHDIRYVYVVIGYEVMSVLFRKNIAIKFEIF